MAILATCVRNEGPYLLEWIAYNKLIGFKKIIIYSNNNTDGSDSLLASLHDRGHILWRPRLLGEGVSPQASAFESLSQELLHEDSSAFLEDIEPEHRYLAWLDCDEYLYIRQSGIETVQDLLEMYSYPDGLSINWKHFGSSDHVSYDLGLTIDRFQRCATTDFFLNKMMKTICKIDPLLFPGVITQHRPCNRNPLSKIIYPDPSIEGPEVPAAFIDQGVFASDIPEAKVFHEVCHLNHYAVRSLQEYNLKRGRGNGWDVELGGKPAYPDDYFSVRDRNEIVDASISVAFSERLRNMILTYEDDIVKHSLIIQKRLRDESPR